MFDPNEAFEYEFEHEDYEPLTDDIIFDDKFINNREMRSLFNFMSKLQFIKNKFIIIEDWYEEFARNPDKNNTPVLIKNEDLVKDVEDLTNNYSYEYYLELSEKYLGTDDELDFLKYCDVFGVYQQIPDSMYERLQDE